MGIRRYFNTLLSFRVDETEVARALDVAALHAILSTAEARATGDANAEDGLFDAYVGKLREQAQGRVRELGVEAIGGAEIHARLDRIKTSLEKTAADIEDEAHSRSFLIAAMTDIAIADCQRKMTRFMARLDDNQYPALKQMLSAHAAFWADADMAKQDRAEISRQFQAVAQTLGQALQSLERAGQAKLAQDHPAEMTAIVGPAPANAPRLPAPSPKNS